VASLREQEEGLSSDIGSVDQSVEDDDGDSLPSRLCPAPDHSSVLLT
jgi:hypothetical protein